ncbi:MAG: hypothetical protein QM811_20605 [Pirellulales bacterium]
MPDEVAFHDAVDDLDKLERRLQDSRKRCDAAVTALEQLRAQIKSAKEAYQRVAGVLKTAPNGPLKTSLERDHREQAQLIARLKKDLPPPGEIGGHVPLKGLLAEQAALRAELAAGAARAKRIADRVPEGYALAAADTALSPLFGAERKLGPAKRWNADLKKLADLERTVRSPTIPFYREGKHVRVGLLLNEEVPAVFAWESDAEATVIPGSLVATLGLTDQLETAAQTMTIDGVKVEVRPLNLKNMRAGRSMKENLRVWALPPEYEYLGARLGYDLRKELKLTLNEDRLTVECGKGTSSGKESGGK